MTDKFVPKGRKWFSEAGVESAACIFIVGFSMQMSAVFVVSFGVLICRDSGIEVAFALEPCKKWFFDCHKSKEQRIRIQPVVIWDLSCFCTLVVVVEMFIFLQGQKFWLIQLLSASKLLTFTDNSKNVKNWSLGPCQLMFLLTEDQLGAKKEKTAASHLVLVETSLSFDSFSNNCEILQFTHCFVATCKTIDDILHSFFLLRSDAENLLFQSNCFTQLHTFVHMFSQLRQCCSLKYFSISL